MFYMTASGAGGAVTNRGEVVFIGTTGVFEQGYDSDAGMGTLIRERLVDGTIYISAVKETTLYPTFLTLDSPGLAVDFFTTLTIDNVGGTPFSQTFLSANQVYFATDAFSTFWGWDTGGSMEVDGAQQYIAQVDPD